MFINRKNFLAMHPISGTENSGPYSAKKNLYFNITNIICEPELTSPDLLDFANSLFKKFNMKIINMDPASHDQHISYVSHLSHITSFTLAKTVIQKERNEKNIFDLAGSGFESTVRLAKSSSEMWTPIFLQNKENILEALKDYQGRIKVTLVPNLTNICYGRGVGYKIEEIVLSEEIQKISATKIRAKMREDGELK